MQSFTRLFLGFFLLALLPQCQPAKPSQADEQTEVPTAFAEHLAPRMSALLAWEAKPGHLPRTIEPDGKVRTVNSRDWTSGFFPGTLWLAYQLSGDSAYRQAAEGWTALLASEQYDDHTHDVGFKINCSYGEGMESQAHLAEYRQVMITAAKTLSERFNPTVGSIRSWDWGEWQFPVIVDNMMNLELLYLASQLSGDSTFAYLATQHALTTMEHHYRPDHSSVHVVDYDTLTGEPIAKVTHQGYADSSTWARGQSWGLYGFTLCYQYTQDPRFLQQAQEIADFLLSHPNLPADKVPYWDYDAPNIPDEPRDASAAAIMASALYQLDSFLPEHTRYRTAADTILNSLLSDAYLRPLDQEIPFLLVHSTGNLPGDSEIDVPINYADYYLLEAIKRQGGQM